MVTHGQPAVIALRLVHMSMDEPTVPKPLVLFMSSNLKPSKSHRRALQRANKQLASQQRSVERNKQRRQASGHYTAMELIAMESQRGVTYYQGERKRGAGNADMSWRDRDSMGH